MTTPLELFPVCEASRPSEIYEVIDLVSSESEADPSVDVSPLHHGILSFALRCVPLPKEAKAVAAIREAVQSAARKLLPHCHVSIFGSKATGLSLPSSDVDVVILGTAYDIYAPQQSFTNAERRQIETLLREVRHDLLSSNRGTGKLILAKVPILRLEMASCGLMYCVDISIGVRNSVDAVDMIRRHVWKNPVILPLFVVLKALLKEKGLNEVYTGGLSSYSLFTTVVAHLIMENCHRAPEKEERVEGFDVARQEETLGTLLASLDLPLDELLLRYLKRFGAWDAGQAVSLQGCGTVPVTNLYDIAQSRALHVEDPQAPGKDASRGSFAVGKVLEAFKEAGETLQAARGKPGHREIFHGLNAIMDCERVLLRPSPRDPRKRDRYSPPLSGRHHRKRKRQRRNSKHGAKLETSNHA